jgi:2-polyprenyl-6-hydroxyphenyl methylase/3-demethylubiquinone-9 3-methyltransferase
MAEKILGSVSPGTHTYDKFINPDELVQFFREDMRWFRGRPTRLNAEIRGIIYLPWDGKWTLAPRGQWGTTQCNYIFWARKPFS